MSDSKPGSTPNQDRVVVVTFDALSRGVQIVQPDPAPMAHGDHRLYFALQTLEGDGIHEAEFVGIEANDFEAHASSVGGCRQLWSLRIDNTISGPNPEPHPYTITVSYAGHLATHDPTVLLKPPPPPPY